MIKNKNVLAITLARGGSKSVPNKNIKKILGKPLIYYTIKEVLKSKYIDEYIVSTDSKKIGDIAKKFGAKVPFYRQVKYQKIIHHLKRPCFMVWNYMRKFPKKNLITLLKLCAPIH